MEPLSLYQIIDVVIKLTAGIFIVIYLNNRNNNIKKKEILYNLALNLLETSHTTYANSIDASIYHLLNCTYDTNKGNSNYTDKVLKFIDVYSQKYKLSSDIFLNKTREFERIVETIELIVGRKTKSRKWKEMKNEALDAIYLRYDYFKDLNHHDFDAFILHEVKQHFNGLITDQELSSEIDDKIIMTIHDFIKLKSKEKKIVNRFIDNIFITIQKL
jgi:hypothetical protein